MNTIPTLAVIDGTPRALSTDIAEHFGKQHGHVLRAIDNLTKNLPADRLSNFGETVIIRPNPTGGAEIETRAYHLTRDGFTLLAMSFTGKRALQFKLAYIDAFNQMEASLRQSLPPLPYKEQPGQSLSEEQCAELRDMLTGAAAQVPREMRRVFMVQGWSRLKAHFGCSYRQIPAERFDEATDLIARHVACYLPPALPALPEATELAQEMLRRKRMMLHFDHNNTIQMKEIDDHACIIDPRNEMSLLTLFYECVPVEHMPAIMRLCTYFMDRQQIDRTTKRPPTLSPRVLSAFSRETAHKD